MIFLKEATLHERYEINYSKNIIYLENTLQMYLKEVNKFADYLVNKGLRPTLTFNRRYQKRKKSSQKRQIQRKKIIRKC